MQLETHTRDEVVVSTPCGDNRLIQSDPGLSNPVSGIFVSVHLTNEAKFGGKLSPRLNDNQDFFTIVAPDGQSKSSCNVVVRRASR